MTKVTVVSASTAKSSKVGNSVQLSLNSVGSKTSPVKLIVKTPEAMTYILASATIAKNKSFVGPVIKFAKPGTYVFTLSIGSTKKLVTVKVSK